jgi:uncharacterized NAD-dependent epimerase/dehydratase family protein
MRHTEIPIPPLGRLINLHEAILEPIHPSQVTGIGLNCFGMSPEQTSETVTRTQQETGLPAADCVRTDVGPLVDGILERLA